MTARRGYSLIETLAAITLVSTTFTTVAVALHGMYRSTQRVQEELAVERELERFSVQFRADAHEATSAKAEPSSDPKKDPQILSLSLADKQIAQYTLQPQRIDRALRRGDEVRHRETYRLPKGSVSRWQVQGERQIAIVSLILERQPAGSGGLRAQTVHVDAAVGLLRSPSASSE